MAQDTKTLPRWAQDRLANLEMRLRQAEDRVQALASGTLCGADRPSGLVVVLREGYRDQPAVLVPVPEATAVRRGTLCDGIDVHPAEERHYGRHAVSVRSGTGYLYVTPCSGNHVVLSTGVPR